MNVVIYSREPLVFRDGRPFGDPGHVNGGTLRWPWPSTITGMLRTRIGLSRESNFFQTKKQQVRTPEKVARLQKIHAARTVPLWCENGDTTKWQYLFPVPADAVIRHAGEENTFEISGVEYENPFTLGGVNLPWRNWRQPETDRPGKPATDSPELWYQEHFFTWLKTGALDGSISAIDLGLSYPEPEIRMHTAIDRTTGAVKKSQLFSSRGIHLRTGGSANSKAGLLGIGVKLTNLEDKDDPTGPCYLGAERRTAMVETLPVPFPSCPAWFDNRKFLRLILISPGNFEAWAPAWLIPDHNRQETDWKQVPTTDIFIRLCSAIVPRWQGVSGWDYWERAPKATRRLVPAGAVYIVEVQDRQRSREVAGLLWGRSIANHLSDPDGCGAVCVGNVEL